MSLMWSEGETNNDIIAKPRQDGERNQRMVSLQPICVQALFPLEDLLGRVSSA